MSLIKQVSLVFSFLVAFGTSHSQSAFAMSVGDAAPQVSGVNQIGKTVHFNELYNKNKYLVVYFYPKADTPGCTAQANSLKDSYALLNKKGAIVVGVSTDNVPSQKQFQDKYKLPFDLIADENKSILKAFGVDSTMGFAQREAFLVHKSKIVWLDANASTKAQAADIIKAIELVEKPNH